MNSYKILFNKANLFSKELKYIRDAYKSAKLSGDGKYTRKCHTFLEQRLKVNKTLLTTSCTHALEMSALLAGIKEGDEIICPSYTFVSTANAFVLYGAVPVFCDIRRDTLNIDAQKIEKLITSKTKAIVVVHYAGIPCEMDQVMALAKKYNLWVIEDAAQAIDSEYKGKKAGSFGDFACLSFHETKNFTMGEGGALLVNNHALEERAEIIREKGTNRSKFFRGEIDKYSWVDVGSSFLPSDINAAILWRQLELFDHIQQKRKGIYELYDYYLSSLVKRGCFETPIIPDHIQSNYHMYYLLLKSEETRNQLMDYLKSRGVLAVFHYLPLHKSAYYRNHYPSVDLPVTEQVSRTLLRLPFYYSLKKRQIQYICKEIFNYFTHDD